MFDASQFTANSPAANSTAPAMGWVRTPRALNSTVLVAHSSPVIAEGLMTVLRRLEGCDVRAWDTVSEGSAASCSVVLVDDFALAAGFATCAGAVTGPKCTATPKVVLLMDAGRKVDAAAFARKGVSACLSLDCQEEELLGAVRELLEDALPGRWSAPIQSDGVARRVPNFAVAAARVRPTGGLAPGALRRVREYIETTFARKIDLSHLAGIAGLSTSHFSRAFKQSIGMPPHRYVLVRRLAAAAELIRKTAKPLAEVAIEVGFSDQPHFTRIFTQITGETPGSLRRRYR